MKCLNCNNDNPEGVEQCQFCHASLNQTTASTDTCTGTDACTGTDTCTCGNTQQKTKFPGLTKIIAICATAIVLILVVSMVFSGGSEPYPENTFKLAYNADDDQTIIFVNDKVLDTKIDGEAGETGEGSRSNLESTCMTALTDEGELYYITKKKAVKVLDEVKLYYLSADGKIIVYFDKEDELRIYDVRKESSETISDNNVMADSIVISPNGKTVLYCEAKGETGEIEMLVYYDGESESMGKDMFPISTSDKGKYIYYVNTDSTLYYTTRGGDEKEKIGSAISDGVFIINSDATQLLFYADGGTYITSKGKEKNKIGSSMYPYMNNFYSYQNFGSDTYMCYTDDFTDNIFADGSNSSIYTIDSKFEKTKIASSISDVIISKDLEKIVYLKDNSIYRAKMDNPDDADELVDDEAVKIAATSDCKYVYFIDEDDSLWCIKNSKKERIADDVDSIYMTADDVLLFLTEYSNDMGTLYYSKNGSDKKKIADDVYDVLYEANAAYYTTDYNNGRYTVYISDGGAKFEVAAEEVTFIN